MARRKMGEGKAEVRERLGAFERVAKRFEHWGPAGQVLTRVKAVRTIFAQIDRATHVGGWPTQRFAIVHGPSNQGKAQPVDEPVLTPTGWRAIGMLAIGDLVVGTDGKAHAVLGIFDRGEREVYRVEASDGSSTRCCAEHLWETTTARELDCGRYARGPRPGRERVATGIEGCGSVKMTREIAETLNEVHYLPRCAPMEGWNGRGLSIDPYVLGLLLGDGSLVGASITFSGEDDELHESLARWAALVGDEAKDATSPGRCRGTRIVGGRRGESTGSEVRRRLEEVGIGRVGSPKKHVPHEYLMADIESRRELLCGLLDTDGTVANEGTAAQFCTTSPDLRDAVVFLVRSLGGRASWAVKETERLDAYIVQIAFDDFCPFRLERKKSAWGERAKRVRRRITSIEKVGRERCVCISVDSPDSLYITNDYLPTHNTSFVHGLGLSFLKAGGFYGYVDAEYTTPEDWLVKLMAEHASNPAFVALRPESFEQTVEAVRSMATGIMAAREAKEIPLETPCLIVVDSIRKLVPQGLLDKLLKADGGIDGAKGRGQMMKAALNAQWLDELIPLLYRSNISMVFITREIENADASGSIYDADYKVTGGRALFFDSSLACRVSRAAWVKRGSDESTEVLGEKHRVRIYKTKVGGKDGKYEDAHFYTSNGRHVPEGFDHARELVELGLDLGLLTRASQKAKRSEAGAKKGGAWIDWASTGERFNGEHAMVKALADDVRLFDMLDGEARAAIEKEAGR